ncbi:MAG: HlyD family efflux transporter periplasmic adaptor subunit [Gammaproteobacteria bacterium]
MITQAINANRWGFVFLLCFFGATITGCDSVETGESVKPPARPVSYVTLKHSDPSRQSLIAGSVESWKKELVGFQVGGRLQYVREPGVNVQGRVIDEGSEAGALGTLIGSLENERYRLRVEEAKARVMSIEGEAEATRTAIEQTTPSQIREIQAEYNRAQAELKRQERLLTQGAGAQVRVDNARAQFKAAGARIAQARSGGDEKTAQLASIEAQVMGANEALRQAQIDLADTELYSPFNGQISKVHVIPGGYVEPGQPVATVQMMDPMKVQVAVSPDTDREVNFNDLMKVYIDGAQAPLNGWVWNKDTVADASTRAFMITLLVRTRQIEIGLPPELEGKHFHRTPGIWNLESELDNGAAPFFTNIETLRKDDGGYFVWKVEGLAIADLEHDFDPVFRVKKVRVTPGSRRFRYLEVFTYQELADLGGLDPRTDLLAGELPPDVKDGDSVFFSRKRWLLRPGQLVNVDLHHGRMPAGFYVPAESIVNDGTDHFVYAVEEQANGEEQAVRIDVRPGANVGTFQAIEPVADDGLAQGMKLIVGGVHYLRDGDAINASNEVEYAL